MTQQNGDGVAGLVTFVFGLVLVILIVAVIALIADGASAGQIALQLL